MKGRIDALHAADPDNDAPIPVDLVTSSGEWPRSGHQPGCRRLPGAPRGKGVASTRGASARSSTEHTEDRQLGILGERRVNVLELNLALDDIEVEHYIEGDDAPRPRRASRARPSRRGAGVRGKLDDLLRGCAWRRQDVHDARGCARRARIRSATWSSASSRRTSATRPRRSSSGSSCLPRKTIEHQGIALEELDLDGVTRAPPAARHRRRARPHERARLAGTQAVAGRRGDPRRGHRRVHDAQRPAPREPQRRRRADHRRRSSARRCRTRCSTGAHDVRLVDLPVDELLERLA